MAVINSLVDIGIMSAQWFEPTDRHWGERLGLGIDCKPQGAHPPRMAIVSRTGRVA